MHTVRPQKVGQQLVRVVTEMDGDDTGLRAQSKQQQQQQQQPQQQQQQQHTHTLTVNVILAAAQRARPTGAHSVTPGPPSTQHPAPTFPLPISIRSFPIKGRSAARFARVAARDDVANENGLATVRLWRHLRASRCEAATRTA